MESFDAFLIQLPTEMKSDDCQINRSKNATPLNVPSIEQPPQPMKISKRKRPNSYLPCIESDLVPKNREISNLPPIIQPSVIKFANSSNMNRSSHLSNSVAQIGQGITVQKIVSDVSETSKSSVLIMPNANGNKSNASSKQVVNPPTILARRQTICSESAKSRILLSLNNQKIAIALNRFPIVSLEKLRIKSNDSAVGKNPILKSNETGNEKPRTKIIPIQKENSKPKRVDERRKAIDCITKQIGNISLVSKRNPPPVNLSVSLPINSLAPSRTSSRNRMPINRYQCDFCSYNSVVKSNFDRHLLMHQMWTTLKKNKQLSIK